MREQSSQYSVLIFKCMEVAITVQQNHLDEANTEYNAKVGELTF
jgi:hypothetical protein